MQNVQFVTVPISRRSCSAEAVHMRGTRQPLLSYCLAFASVVWLACSLFGQEKLERLLSLISTFRAPEKTVAFV